MMATGSDSAGPSNVDIQPVIEAPVEGAMAVYGGRPAPVNQDIEVLDCHGCTMGSHQFWVEYGGKMERVIKLCQDHGVILKTKNCIKCGEVCRLDIHRLAFRCDKLFVVRCQKRQLCNFSVSIFKGTWFDHTKLDIETNLKFVILFIRNYFSCQLARDELTLSDICINDWSSFCREVLIAFVLDHHSGPIGGPGLTVEIDESKFGKRKYNVGRVIEGQWVFGGICRESKDFFMVPVKRCTAETLLPIITARIANGTKIISDCWKAYDCLEQQGYRHLKVNHSINFVDPETGAHTNTIERKWRDAKNFVPKYGRRSSHFVDYLATSFFKSHFKEANERFHHFLVAAGKLYTPTP